MFDYKTIVADDELKLSFTPIEADKYNAVNTQTGEIAGVVSVDGGVFEASDPDVFTQYKLWQTRPERSVGRLVEIQGKNMEELIEAYEELFIGAYILTQHCKIEKGHTPGFALAIDWLRTTDFYKAPASTKYHESFPGGLLVHSLNVYNNMVKLLALEKFSKVNVAEATIAALVHDWCKIGYYEPYQKNVKNEKTGEWEKQTAYKVNQIGIPLGHGTTSLYIAMKVMRLTDEQALAIRWHMSVWNVAEVEKSELQTANSKYPMVYLIQFADQLACTEY